MNVAIFFSNILVSNFVQCQTFYWLKFLGEE